jgi:spore germination protein YaaH
MSDKHLRLSAWLPSGEAALKSFEAHASRLTRVYPLWYRLGDEGLAMRRLNGSEAARARVREVAKAHGVEVWPQISDLDESQGARNPGRVARLLQDPKVLAFHRSGLEKLIAEDGARGVSVDYQVDQPRLQALLDQFIFASPCLGLLQLKAFRGAGSGAIAPIALIASLLKLAVSEASAASTELGFPGYGYDRLGAKAVLLDYAGWDSLVAAHGPARRDAESGELVLNYGGHEAWFCDSIATLRKLLQAREAGVDQAALWMLGSEDPRLWSMLEDFPVPFSRVLHGR